MPWYVKGTDTEIIGTCDKMLATAHITDDPGEDGEPEFMGQTTVHWDTQETTQCESDGEDLYVTDAWEIFPRSQIEWRLDNDL